MPTYANKRFVLFPIVVAVVFGARLAAAGIVAEHRGAYIKLDAIAESFSVEITDVQQEYGISVTAILDAGSGSLRVLDPDGAMIYQHLWSDRYSQERARLPVTKAGSYTVAVSIDKGRGEWRARIVALPSRAALKWMYLSAGLLIVIPVAMLGAAYWHGASIRWAALGAIVFVSGRLIWLVGAVILDISARYALEDAMPYRAFLWVQSLMLGLWQGLAASLAVLAFAFLVKPLRQRPLHAIAVGIGAGGFEMAMTGVISLLGLSVMFGGGPKSDKAQFTQAYDMAVTAVLPVAEPMVLGLTSACTVAATLLIVYGIRVQRFSPVLGGAAVFGTVLTAIGASRGITLFGPESRWVIAVLLLPVAVLSLVLIRRNLPYWVASPRSGETALDAFVRQHDGDEN
jgi:hypothetical protein